MEQALSFDGCEIATSASGLLAMTMSTKSSLTEY